MKEKICFIVQRYGAQVNGGAELFCKQVAEHMTEKYDVTVLTTCAVDYITWEDYYAPGEEMINGVRVLRFRPDYTRDVANFNALNGRFLQKMMSEKEEQEWVNLQGPYCAGITEYVEKQVDSYKAFVFCTYLYYPTVMGLPKASQRAVFVPMAHDEPYIQMEIFKKLFVDTKTIFYLTPEEKAFVSKTFENQEVRSEIGGIGVDIPEDCSAQRFRTKYKISEEYIIYVGRIDEGKNCKEMFAFWQMYKKKYPSDIKLVLLGKAVIPVPEREDIVELGFVSDEDKFDAIAGAKFMWVPSKFESLSISLLESLSLSVPVLVNGHCEVLKGHCLRSNAGFYYEDYPTFEACFDILQNNPEILASLAQAAPSYVKKYFSWENTTEKLETLISYVGENNPAVLPLQESEKSEKIKKIGFVVPWFGEKSVGGAEMALRDIAIHLQKKGVDLEILTTCAKENGREWGKNYYIEEIDEVYGIKTRRFMVEPRKNIFYPLNEKIVARKELTQEEESLFLANYINSDRLYTYIREHKDEYSQFVFIPYLFSTSYFGSAAAGDKAVLIPCFHDEGYAYMQLLKNRYSAVTGMAFLSEKEEEFAQNTYDLQNVKTVVAGLGIDISKKGNAQRFRQKFEIEDPFILYVGRRNPEKNTDMLVSYFAQYKKEHPSNLKLVLVGNGKVQRTWTENNEEIIDLEFLDEQDKTDAYAAASLLCQPSFYESFSLVIMESWLQARPVLVHENCEVTKNFAQQSNGGLYFNGYAQFNQCVSTILENPELADEMGRLGKQFVETNFNWDAVTQRYIDFFTEIAKQVDKE